MGHNCLRSCGRMVPLLLFVLCASAAASGGKNWQPNCGSVSSGCTYCSYIRRSGTSNNQRGLRQVQDPISETAAVLLSGSTSEPMGAQTVEVAALAAAPQAAALSLGSSSDQQITPQASRWAGRRGAMFRSNSSSSTGSRAGGTQRSRRSGSTATSGNDDKLSWGYSDTWWQPGAALSCDECDTSRNYQHLTSMNGTGYCGCSAGHGVVPKGASSASVRASAWKSTYVKTFTCQACPENHVPFQPGSNLYVAFDGADWSLKCIDQSSGLTGRPKVAPPSGAGDVIDVVASVPTPGRPKGSPVALSNYTALEAGVMPTAAVAIGALVAPAAGSDFGTSAVEVAHAKRRQQIQSGWYRRGRRRTRGIGSRITYDCAPWLPGQCIDCALVGAEADPTGTYCDCNGGGPPPPSPSPSPSPFPSPSPGGVCIECNVKVIQDTMTNVCIDVSQVFALIGPSAPCQNTGDVNLNLLDCFAEPPPLFADNEGSCIISCSYVRNATQADYILSFASTEDVDCDSTPYPIRVPVITRTSRPRIRRKIKSE